MGKKDIYFDVRVSDRYVKEGTISQKEFDDHLKGLPDVTDKGTELIVEFEEEDTEEKGAE